MDANSWKNWKESDKRVCYSNSDVSNNLRDEIEVTQNLIIKLSEEFSKASRNDYFDYIHHVGGGVISITL